MEYFHVTGQLRRGLYLAVQSLYCDIEKQKVINHFVEKELGREFEHQSFVCGIDRPRKVIEIILKNDILQHCLLLPESYQTIGKKASYLDQRG